jgi:hypothetical protein
MTNNGYEEIPMDAEEYTAHRLTTIPDSTGMSSGVPCPPKPGANPEAAALWCPDCRNPEGLCDCWISWLYFWNFDPPPPDLPTANQKT